MFWFSVDVHLHEDVCARPVGHLVPCDYRPIDIGCPHSDDEPCLDCLREDAMWERADHEREDRAVGL